MPKGTLIVSWVDDDGGPCVTLDSYGDDLPDPCLEGIADAVFDGLEILKGLDELQDVVDEARTHFGLGPDIEFVCGEVPDEPNDSPIRITGADLFLDSDRAAAYNFDEEILVAKGLLLIYGRCELWVDSDGNLHARGPADPISL